MKKILLLVVVALVLSGCVGGGSRYTDIEFEERRSHFEECQKAFQSDFSEYNEGYIIDCQNSYNNTASRCECHLFEQEIINEGWDKEYTQSSTDIRQGEWVAGGRFTLKKIK